MLKRIAIAYEFCGPSSQYEACGFRVDEVTGRSIYNTDSVRIQLLKNPKYFLRVLLLGTRCGVERTRPYRRRTWR